jgi:hypothetical protein
MDKLLIYNQLRLYICNFFFDFLID